MKIYNLDEVCELLKMNKQTIRKYIRNGKLKASKVGTHYMVQDEAIKEFLKDTQIQPKTEDKEA